MKRWYFVECPFSDYGRVRDVQHAILEAKRKGASYPDVVLFVEHDPVFTLGRRGGTENLRVSRRVLEEAGIGVIEVERGGDVTYHGPGQLVGYPIVDLKQNGLGVLEYVEKLEETMILIAKRWDVPAGRNDLNRGAWVEDRKLGSVGIAVRRGIAFHGFALNVDLSLEPYGWINPCGLKNVSMTSLALEASRPITVKEAKAVAEERMPDIFGVKGETMAFEDLNIGEP